MVDAEQGRRRLAALAAQVGGHVDAVLCMNPENLYFFTGFRTMLYTRFTAVLIRLDQPAEPVLFALSVDRPLIEGRVWSPTWLDQVVYHGTNPGLPATPSLALSPYLQGVGRLGVDAIKLSDAAVIEAAAPGVQLLNLTAQIDALKLVKVDWELEHLRAANQLALDGIRHAQAMLASGPTTELALAVELEARARLSGADGFGYPTLVSGGPKMCAVHSPALPLPIQHHQPLRIAFGPMVEGYTADVVRTLCLGEPPALLVQLQDAFLAAQAALISRLRAGVTVAELMAAVRAEYAARQVLVYWRNNIGHGLGLTIHEPPKVGGASTEVLTSGMVVALEPNLFVPGFGGYAHCDVVHVTEHGCDLLTPGLQGIVPAHR